MIIKKGQIITFSEGEYSDYCVKALVSASKEFSVKEKQGEWELECTDPDNNKHMSRQLKVDGINFLPWLVLQGLVEYADGLEIHMGSYGILATNISRKVHR